MIGVSIVKSRRVANMDWITTPSSIQIQQYKIWCSENIESTDWCYNKNYIYFLNNNFYYKNSTFRENFLEFINDNFLLISIGSLFFLITYGSYYIIYKTDYIFDNTKIFYKRII